MAEETLGREELEAQTDWFADSWTVKSHAVLRAALHYLARVEELERERDEALDGQDVEHERGEDFRLRFEETHAALSQARAREEELRAALEQVRGALESARWGARAAGAVAIARSCEEALALIASSLPAPEDPRT